MNRHLFIFLSISVAVVLMYFFTPLIGLVWMNAAALCHLCGIKAYLLFVFVVLTFLVVSLFCLAEVILRTIEKLKE